VTAFIYTKRDSPGGTFTSQLGDHRSPTLANHTSRYRRTSNRITAGPLCSSVSHPRVGQRARHLHSSDAVNEVQLSNTSISEPATILSNWEALCW
jgi:hypothetical protein